MSEAREAKKATELESIFRRVPKWQDLWFYQKSESRSEPLLVGNLDLCNINNN